MATRRRPAPRRAEIDDSLRKLTDEANAAFTKMGQVVEEAVKSGAKELNVVEVSRRAGLQIDERILEELHIDRVIYPLPWLPWHHWWPWRPLWCWWWRFYPWYRCCPWWWHRCHWWID